MDFYSPIIFLGRVLPAACLLCIFLSVPAISLHHCLVAVPPSQAKKSNFSNKNWTSFHIDYHSNITFLGRVLPAACLLCTFLSVPAISQRHCPLTIPPSQAKKSNFSNKSWTSLHMGFYSHIIFLGWVLPAACLLCTFLSIPAISQRHCPLTIPPSQATKSNFSNKSWTSFSKLFATAGIQGCNESSGGFRAWQSPLGIVFRVGQCLL